MALEACVGQVLRMLSIAALRAMCAAIQAQLLLIKAEILKLEGQLVQYDVIAAFIAAQQAAINAALDPIEEKLQFYPRNFARLIAECVQMGDIITSPQDVLEGIRGLSNEWMYKAQAVTTLNGIVLAKMNSFLDLSDLLNDTCTLIEQIIVEKTTPAA